MGGRRKFVNFPRLWEYIISELMAFLDFKKNVLL